MYVLDAVVEGAEAHEVAAGLIEPIPALQNIDGAVDINTEMRQARAVRVEEFSRRNRLIAQAERTWLEVRADEVYPYRPKKRSRRPLKSR